LGGISDVCSVFVSGEYMKLLTLSDIEIPFIYSPLVAERFCNIDIIIACGDLPYYYLEYVINALNIPAFFVRGNHAKEVEYTTGGIRKSPHGGVDLHRRLFNQDGLLLAGIEGSVRYRKGPYMYTQGEMWCYIFGLVPGVLWNRMRYGRFLDIFVTHAPPWGIHDQPDLPHQGIKAFTWFVKVFQPAYHFHGHIHVYHPDTVTDTLYGRTKIINTFGYRETLLDNGPRKPSKPRF
jgi:uncharacterized protein